MLFLFKVIHPCKIAVHFRDPFLVIGLVVPAPVRQFLFVPERFPPALPAHDHFHLRGQFLDERSDSPSFRMCLSILTFVAISSFISRVPVCIFKLKPDRFVHLIKPIYVAGSKFEGSLAENLFRLSFIVAVTVRCLSVTSIPVT